MKNTIYPILFALVLGVGFTACGGDKGGGDLAAEKAKLDEQQEKVDRIKILQAKVADGTISEDEQKELDDLYAWLEAEGTKCPDGVVPPEGETCPPEEGPLGE